MAHLLSILASAENAEKYVLACLSLQNYLHRTNNACYTPAGFVDAESGDGTLIHGDWRKEIPDEGNCL